MKEKRVRVICWYEGQTTPADDSVFKSEYYDDEQEFDEAIAEFHKLTFEEYEGDDEENEDED